MESKLEEALLNDLQSFLLELGLILCTDKNDAVVKYTMGDGNPRIFASGYKLHLPSADWKEAEAAILDYGQARQRFRKTQERFPILMGGNDNNQERNPDRTQQTRCLHSGHCADWRGPRLLIKSRRSMLGIQVNIHD